MTTTAPDSDLVRRLLPNSDDTAEVVTASAQRALDGFANVAVLLLGMDGLDAHRDAITSSLERMAAEPSDTLLRRACSPVFRSWLADFVCSEDSRDPAQRIRSMVELWPNMTRSLVDAGDWTEMMRVLDGTCMTADPRLAVTGIGSDRVLVTKTNDELAVQDGDTGELVARAVVAVAGDGLSLRPLDGVGGFTAGHRLPGTSIVVRNDLPLLRVRLRAGGEAPSRDGGWERSVWDDDDHYGPFDPEPFVEASEQLRTAWPEEHEDWRWTLQVVVPRSAPPGWRVGGFTISTYQGACWVVGNNEATVFETLVHEQSHVKLRYLEPALPILEARQPEGLFQVGWRSDPRPIVGIYEGVYVNAHCVMAIARALDARVVPATARASWSKRLADLRQQVLAGVDVLDTHARFTEVGLGFVPWARDVVRQH